MCHLKQQLYIYNLLDTNDSVNRNLSVEDFDNIDDDDINDIDR